MGQNAELKMVPSAGENMANRSDIGLRRVLDDLHKLLILPSKDVKGVNDSGGTNKWFGMITC